MSKVWNPRAAWHATQRNEWVNNKRMRWLALQPWLPGMLVVLATLGLAWSKGIATTHSSQAQAEQARQQWVQAIAQRRTADGSTVAEVLAYAERERPDQFKVADIDVRYSGADGGPESVLITYWIGNNRKRNDSYVDLSYPVAANGQIQAVPRSAITLRALESGKTAFLQQIDGIYAMACKPFPESKARC